MLHYINGNSLLKNLPKKLCNILFAVPSYMHSVFVLFYNTVYITFVCDFFMLKPMFYILNSFLKHGFYQKITHLTVLVCQTFSFLKMLASPYWLFLGYS